MSKKYKEQHTNVCLFNREHHIFCILQFTLSYYLIWRKTLHCAGNQTCGNYIFLILVNNEFCIPVIWQCQLSIFAVYNFLPLYVRIKVINFLTCRSRRSCSQKVKSRGKNRLGQIFSRKCTCWRLCSTRFNSMCFYISITLIVYMY